MERNMINKPANSEQTALTGEDLRKIFNYPSVGELFSGDDSRKLAEFRRRLALTGENLERIIRSGSQSEAASAQLAVNAVKVTLEFLENLENLHQNEEK